MLLRNYTKQKKKRYPHSVFLAVPFTIKINFNATFKKLYFSPCHEYVHFFPEILIEDSRFVH